MSRILRRPMFRGGSPNNGGIMSYAQPRKGYQEAGFVNEEEIGGNENFLNTGTITRPTSSSFFDKDFTETTPTSTDAISTDRLQKKAREGDLAQKLGLSPLGQRLKEQYLSQRTDPIGKFLINFGLNYMSARPRGGKFGFITTASDAAQKPTEELFADIDKERELKLKLMSILGKSETKGAFEKKVNFIWETEKTKIERGLTPTFKTKEDVVDYIRKQESETKSQSVEDQVNNEAKKRIESNQAPNFKVAKNMAYFDLFGMEKIPKEEANALANRYFLPPNALTPKPNSTDFTLTDVKNLESTLGKLKEGQTYVDPFRRQVFLYAGPNTFRPLSKF